MSSRFIVLAGPQCGGKTTAKQYLYARYMVAPRDAPASGGAGLTNLVLLQEMRQLVMHERQIHSAIFIDSRTERDIIERDLARMDEILRDGESRVYLDETNVFTLAHAQTRGLPTEHYVDAYAKRLHALGAGILFFSVSPSSSWTRRKHVYEQRVRGFPLDQAAVVLRQYRQYMEDVHPRLMNLLDRLALPVRSIDSSGTVEDTLNGSAHAFVDLMSESESAVFARF